LGSASFPPSDPSCRKLAFLLLGTRPLDEEEEALRDVAVIDVPLLRREYRPWVRHRSVRVVLLEAVPGPEPLGRFDRGGEAEGPAARGARLTEEKRAGLSDAIARWLRSAGV